MEVTTCVTIIIISHINLLDDNKKSGILNKHFLSLIFNYLHLSVVEIIRLYILFPTNCTRDLVWVGHSIWILIIFLTVLT